MEIITANMRGAPVEEKPQSLESVSDSAALGDFNADRECRGARQGFVAHLNWQAGGRDSHCPPEKRDPSRAGRKHFTLNNPKIHKSQ